MKTLHQRSKERVAQLGEVFTAEREVNAMLDMLPDDVWSNISETFLGLPVATAISWSRSCGGSWMSSSEPSLPPKLGGIWFY